MGVERTERNVFVDERVFVGVPVAMPQQTYEVWVLKSAQECHLGLERERRGKRDKK